MLKFVDLCSASKPKLTATGPGLASSTAPSSAFEWFKPGFQQMMDRDTRSCEAELAQNSQRNKTKQSLPSRHAWKRSIISFLAGLNEIQPGDHPLLSMNDLIEPDIRT